MKKIKFSIAAALVALLCIASNAMMATQYYISSTPGIPICVVTFAGGNPCPPGNQVQCSIMVGDNTYWLCKIVDGSACQIHLRGF